MITLTETIGIEMMMAIKEKLFKQALDLPVEEKTELIGQLIKSLDKPDPEIDELWKTEAESRIDAYDRGKVSSVSVQETISKYWQ